MGPARRAGGRYLSPGHRRARLASIGAAGGVRAGRRRGGKAKVRGFPAGGRGGRGSPGAGAGRRRAATRAATRAGEGASLVGTEGRPCEGEAGVAGARRPRWTAWPPAQPGTRVGGCPAPAAWSPEPRVSPAGRARERVSPSCPPAAPPRRAARGRGGGRRAAAARPEGRGGAGPGTRGAGARRGRGGGRGRSRGPGKARPVAQLGPVGPRGGAGRRAVVPFTFPLLSQAGCGPAGDVMGSPSPAPRQGRVGVGKGAGGTPRGFPQQRVEGRGKSL